MIEKFPQTSTVFQLAATGAELTDELIEREIVAFERTFNVQAARIAKKFGVDPGVVDALLRKCTSDLRAALVDARRARQQVITESENAPGNAKEL